MLQIAVPMVLSSGCETIMTFTDRLFLARLGPELMDAAMAGGLTAFMLTTFFLGLTMYTTALAAQYLGSGQKSKCPVALTQALMVCVVAYPVILACRPVGHALFAASKISPEQLAPQKQFFDILLYGSLIGLLRSTIAAYFSAIGRTQVVMVSAMTAMIVNVGANYVMVFGKFGVPALGIRGAAFGTILGATCGLLVLVVCYLSARNREEFHVQAAWRFDREVMGKLLRFGYPNGAEYFLNLTAFNFLILTFHSRGIVAATAVTTMFNWDMVSFIPLMGVNVAVTSLVGRYMGAGKPDIAHRVTMSGLKMAWTYGSCTLLAFSCFPEHLVNMFRPSGDAAIFDKAVPAAVFMLRLASIYVLADATMLVFGGALRGAGDTLWAMTISVGLHWMLVAVLWPLLKVFTVSVETAWAALTVVILFCTALFYLRYRSGRWRLIRIIQPSGPPALLPTDGLHETTDL